MGDAKGDCLGRLSHRIEYGRPCGDLSCPAHWQFVSHAPLSAHIELLETAGSVSLIHPESHFTDEKAGLLRRATYRRLRRHWQFINELVLFEIHDLVRYGVHVYCADDEPSFMQATSLYHPSTVERSLDHDGSGAEPGLKDDEGRWDLRPHASRIQHVDEDTLKTWHAVLEGADVPVEQTRMVYTVNRSTAAVLDKLAAAPRISSLGLQFSAGWHEKNDRTKGYFDSEWGVPESWDSVILQGPHFHVGTPFYKSPNPTMRHNQDWTPIDLEALPADATPATQYKPRGDRATYKSHYLHWNVRGRSISATKFYRVAWRRMAANTGERTLITSIIPPGPTHLLQSVFSLADPEGPPDRIALIAGWMSSFMLDFQVRAAPRANILQGSIEQLPMVRSRYDAEIIERVLRLNCVTSSYSVLWVEIMGEPWSPLVPVRKASERRAKLIEIDALVALAMGFTIEEVLAIYRTQFPVLYGYDRDEYLYDRNGRLVPIETRQAWKKAGLPSAQDGLDIATRTVRHPGSGVEYVYELPFSILDRESDLRNAYAEFERRYAKEA